MRIEASSPWRKEPRRSCASRSKNMDRAESFSKPAVSWSGRCGMSVTTEMNAQKLIAGAYSAFNRRDIDGALALISENVSWPRASEGGRAVGKEEIRAYWTRRWKALDH